MYVLARHEGESVVVLDGLVEIKVLSVVGKIVRLGFDAPREVSIERKEIHVAKGEGDGQHQLPT
ncbi:MAG TPA: carbon storage regulator [Rhizobacter sp.]